MNLWLQFPPTYCFLFSHTLNNLYWASPFPSLILLSQWSSPNKKSTLCHYFICHSHYNQHTSLFFLIPPLEIALVMINHLLIIKSKRSSFYLTSLCYLTLLTTAFSLGFFQYSPSQFINHYMLYVTPPIIKMLHLTDKNFKAAITIMIKDIKKNKLAMNKKIGNHKKYRKYFYERTKFGTEKYNNWNNHRHNGRMQRKEAVNCKIEK